MLRPEVAGLAPRTEKAIGSNPHANGGLLIRELDLPEVDQYAVPVGSPGAMTAEATKVLGSYLRDVIDLNPNNFRLMGPDETASNRLSTVYERTDKVWLERSETTDEHLGPEGRVMEVLSEHLCQGGLRDISSPDGTASSTVTRPSPILSTRCSTSMPNGFPAAQKFRGDSRFLL